MIAWQSHFTGNAGASIETYERFGGGYWTRPLTYTVERLPNGLWKLRDYRSGLERLFDTAAEAKADAERSQRLYDGCTCLPGQVPHEPGCRLWVADF